MNPRVAPAILLIFAIAAAAQTPTTTVLSGFPNTSTFGAAVTLTATVTPVGATGSVTFYDGTAVLGIGALHAGAANFTTRLLGVGARTLSARYQGDSGHAASISGAVAHTVTATAAASMRTGTSYPAGAAPDGVAVADFDNDAVLDLAVCNYDGTVTILLGNGGGTFRTVATASGGASASAIAAGDFNGDGNADLAIANGAGTTVSILLGNGDGSFQTPVPYSAGRSPNWIAVADFNGDGKADLLLETANGATILLGNGDGTLQTASSYYSSPCTGPFAVGDFNRDGKPDVAGIGYYGSLCILIGNGDGSLQGPQTYAYPQYDFGPGNIAVGDFTGDGKLDVAVSLSQFGVGVFPGNGDGSFQAAIVSASQTAYGGYLVAGDFNGDGKLDIAISDFSGATPANSVGAVSILPGNGDGTFQGPAVYGIGQPPSYALAVADFNGDGRTDLAGTTYAASANTVTVLLGQAAATPVLTAVSVTPSAGSGPSQTFTFLFSDTAGASDLSTVELLFGFTDYPLSPSCAVTYNLAQHALYLWHDDGSLPSNGLAPGTGYAQNSPCLLNAVSSSASPAGNQLTLAVTVGFRHFYQGIKYVYGQAIASSGFTTGWQKLGTWTGTQATPQAVSVSPANSTAIQQPLTFTFSDANSAADLSSVFINLNTSSSTVNSCYIVVSPGGGGILLANDSGTNYSSGTLGSGPALSNSQCSVYPALSSASLQANTYTLTVFVRQAFGLNTTWNIYSAASTFNLSSPLQALGTWTSGPAPETLSLNASPSPVAVGQTVTLIAGVTAEMSGNIAFYDGATVLGVAPISNRLAAFTTNLLSTGTHRLTARNQPNPDYAAAVSNAAPVTVRALGGSLVPAGVLNTGGVPTAVVVGDFNLDGIADLAVSNQGDNTVSVFLGVGNGTFQSGATYATAAGPKGLVAGDFNQDGETDLAVATTTGVSVLINNGDGTFQTPQNYAAGSAGASVLAIGDFNNTGTASLAAGGFGSDVVMPGGAGGLFVAAGQIIAPSAGGIVVGDFNGDGNADVAVAPLQGGGLFVLAGKGNLTFQPAAIYSPVPVSPAGILSSLVLADFNGDGFPDLAMSTASGVSVVLGAGDGSFGAPVIYLAGAHPAALAAGDINGDGIADLVVVNATANGAGNSLNILRGKGDGTFSAPLSFPVADSQVGLALADFNGDGRLDLAVTNYNSKSVSILLGTSVVACQVAAGAVIGIADVQQMINEALGASAPLHDLNRDGAVTVADLQIVTNADLGLACRAN